MAKRKTDAKSEQKPESKPESKTVPKPESKTVPKPEPKPEPKPGPKHEPEPEPEVEAGPKTVTAQAVTPIGPSDRDLEPKRRRRKRRSKAEIEAEREQAAQQQQQALTDKAEANLRVLVQGVDPLVARVLPPALTADEQQALVNGCLPYFMEHGGDITPGVLAAVTILAVFGPRLADRIWG